MYSRLRFSRAPLSFRAEREPRGYFLMFPATMAGLGHVLSRALEAGAPGGVKLARPGGVRVTPSKPRSSKAGAHDMKAYHRASF